MDWSHTLCLIILLNLLGFSVSIDSQSAQVITNNFSEDSDSDIKRNKELVVKNAYDYNIEGTDVLSNHFGAAYPNLNDVSFNGPNNQLKDFQITNLILTSDIEGNINAVNRRTGELLWSLVGGQPLVDVQSEKKLKTYPSPTPVGSSSVDTSSTGKIFENNNINLYTSDDKVTNDGRASTRKNNLKNEITWIVEPFNDGAVYHFTGNEGLEKLPLSVKEFVLNSPFSVNDQFVYTGTRMSGIVKVDAYTGEIVETYGLDDVGVCPADGEFYENIHDDENTNDNEIELNTIDHKIEQSNRKNGSVITLGKTIYDLTIHSKNNTSWNITYVQWGPNNLHSNLLPQNCDSIDDIYIQPYHDNTLLALDINTKSIKWVSNLPFVTINVFDVFLNPLSESNDYIILPHPLDKQDNSPPKTNEATYLDRTKSGSWYAMSENHYPSLVRSAPLAKYITNERWRMPSIFANEDLLEISISGVHDNSLKKDSNERNKKKLATSNAVENYLAVYQSATPVPVYGYNGDKMQKVPHYLSNNINNNDINGYDNYMYHQHLQNKQRVLEIGTNSPTMTFNKSSFTNILFRAFENVFVALICLGVFYVLSKLGVLSSIGISQKNEQENDYISSEKQMIIETNTDKPNSSTNNESIISSATSDIEDPKNIPHNKDNSNDTKKDTKLENPVDNHNLNSELEIDNDELGKRKRKRGTRGGKRNKKKDLEMTSTNKTANSDSNLLTMQNHTENGLDAHSDSAVVTINKKYDDEHITEISNNLVITDSILGFGSHGTIVFKGYFENRPVAVKRMLLEFYDVASLEIHLLQESDDHSNVIRYFCSQEKNKFLYIALELCSASLGDIIENKKDIGVKSEDKEILYQISNGVDHLHSLNIVHRDIKPQNILVAVSKKNSKSASNDVRYLISDFGLCKKLDADQSSFKGTTANAAGTSGWRAPELLNDLSPAYMKQNVKNRVRLTKSVDIFSTGCVFFYVLTKGYHPFGDRYIREGNIIKNEYDLSKLNQLKDSYLIKDLISSMIQKNPMIRPDIGTVMKHPFFWSAEKKLEFLLKVSDRFEVERRDPPSPLLLKLESISKEVLGSDGWFDKFDDNFIDNLGKYRKYNTHKLMDLLRAIRNKYHHYQDLPKDLAMEMGQIPDDFYYYFSDKFPRMLLMVYKLVQKILHEDELLVQFF